MAYRNTKIGERAAVAPEEARAMIVAAFEAAGGDAERASKSLKVTRRTFDRIVRTLKFDAQIAKMRREARKARKVAA